MVRLSTTTVAFLVCTKLPFASVVICALTDSDAANRVIEISVFMVFIFGFVSYANVGTL